MCENLHQLFTYYKDFVNIYKNVENTLTKSTGSVKIMTVVVLPLNY